MKDLCWIEVVSGIVSDLPTPGSKFCWCLSSVWTWCFGWKAGDIWLLIETGWNHFWFGGDAEWGAEVRRGVGRERGIVDAQRDWRYHIGEGKLLDVYASWQWVTRTVSTSQYYGSFIPVSSFLPFVPRVVRGRRYMNWLWTWCVLVRIKRKKSRCKCSE